MTTRTTAQRSARVCLNYTPLVRNVAQNKASTLILPISTSMHKVSLGHKKALLSSWQFWARQQVRKTGPSHETKEKHRCQRVVWSMFMVPHYTQILSNCGQVPTSKTKTLASKFVSYLYESMRWKRRTLNDLLQLTKRCGRSQHAETSP